ncbi:hypothetical protein ACFE04_019141 [Oxalis oulophora]
MANCSRCCLHDSMKIVNLITNLCGIGMIVYSLWLEKVWVDGVHEFSSVSHFPKPWFIYTCLGVGIAVCLSTIFGHMVANWMDNSILCVYIVSICSLLLLEIAVIITILFKIDWSKKLAHYIDKDHLKFRNFVLFHIKMCQMMSVVILIPQLNVIAIAFVLRAVGAEPRTRAGYSVVRNFTQSFLVESSIAILPSENQLQACGQCGNLRRTGTPGDWRHIIKQIGMFTFTGLNADQVAFITKEYHIYMTIPHLADAIHAAVTRFRSTVKHVYR